MGPRLPPAAIMPGMDRRLRLLPLLLVLALAVATAAACGGDGEADAAATVTTAAPAAVDPRAGYFGADESAALNPPLAALSAADRTWLADADACNDEAVRLFDAGVPPRRAIACHVRLTAGMRDASRELRVAVGEVEGEFRPACVRELGRYRATVTRLAASWQRTLGLWNAYGRGELDDTERINTAGGRAQTLTRAFLDEGAAGTALTVACYTAEDRAAADRG